MIKLYITAIDSRDNGSAVTLFEDYQLNYENKDELFIKSHYLGDNIVKKIDEVELINEQITKPY